MNATRIVTNFSRAGLVLGVTMMSGVASDALAQSVGADASVGGSGVSADVGASVGGAGVSGSAGLGGGGANAGANAGAGGATGNASASVGSGGADAGASVGVGNASGNASVGVGNGGANASADVGLGNTSGNASISVGDGVNANASLGTDDDNASAGSQASTISDAQADQIGSLANLDRQDLGATINALGSRDIAKLRKTCVAILANPAGFPTDTVQVCKVIASL